MKSLGMTMVLVAMMILGPLAVSAQVRPGGPPGQRLQRQERMQLEQRLHQGFGAMVRNQLGLEEEDLAAVQAVMQSFREDRQALNRDQASLRFRLRDPAHQEMAEEDARAVLSEMVRVQEAELELYRREQAELLTVLNPRQLVQFYRIREDWGQRVQQLRQGGGPGGPGGPGGTAGRPGGTGGSLDWEESPPWIR